MISPYSVSQADVASLLSLDGYAERFIETVQILVDLLELRCNVLEHRRFVYHEKTWKIQEQNKADKTLTCEKYLYVFGSILLHLHIAKVNCVYYNIRVPSDFVPRLENVLRQLEQLTGVKTENMPQDVLLKMTAEKIPGSLEFIQKFFKGARHAAQNLSGISGMP